MLLYMHRKSEKAVRRCLCSSLRRVEREYFLDRKNSQQERGTLPCRARKAHPSPSRPRPGTRAGTMLPLSSS